MKQVKGKKSWKITCVYSGNLESENPECNTISFAAAVKNAFPIFALMLHG
jgi:hypothetical protein